MFDEQAVERGRSNSGIAGEQAIKTTRHLATRRSALLIKRSDESPLQSCCGQIPELIVTTRHSNDSRRPASSSAREELT
jgi:hypothetical protein